MPMSNQLSYREFKSDGAFAEGGIASEFKSVKDGVIEGYGAVFGNVDRGYDVVEPGAFTESLKSGPKVKMLWQHNPHEPIGVWDEVKEDDQGVWVKGHILADVDEGRKATALVRAGAIDGLSIGYKTLKSREAKIDDR